MPSHLELEYGDSANNTNAKIRYVTTRNGKFELSVKLANVHIKEAHLILLFWVARHQPKGV